MMDGRLEGKRSRVRPRQKLLDCMMEKGYREFKERAKQWVNIRTCQRAQNLKKEKVQPELQWAAVVLWTKRIYMYNNNKAPKRLKKVTTRISQNPLNVHIFYSLLLSRFCSLFFIEDLSINFLPSHSHWGMLLEKKEDIPFA